MEWQGTFNKIAEKPPTFSQKFHTDDVSLHRSGHCFWLVETNFSLDTTIEDLTSTLTMLKKVSYSLFFALDYEDT